MDNLNLNDQITEHYGERLSPTLYTMTLKMELKRLSSKENTKQFHISHS